MPSRAARRSASAERRAASGPDAAPTATTTVGTPERSSAVSGTKRVNGFSMRRKKSSSSASCSAAASASGSGAGRGRARSRAHRPAATPRAAPPPRRSGPDASRADDAPHAAPARRNGTCSSASAATRARSRRRGAGRATRLVGDHGARLARMGAAKASAATAPPLLVDHVRRPTTDRIDERRQIVRLDLRRHGERRVVDRAGAEPMGVVRHDGVVAGELVGDGGERRRRHRLADHQQERTAAADLVVEATSGHVEGGGRGCRGGGADDGLQGVRAVGRTLIRAARRELIAATAAARRAGRAGTKRGRPRTGGRRRRRTTRAGRRRDRRRGRWPPTSGHRRRRPAHRPGGSTP